MSANLYGSFRAGFPALERIFLRRPDGVSVSYGELETRTARLAGALRAADVGQGDIVALLVDKSPTAMLIYLAMARIGAVFLPIHTGLAAVEITHILNDAAPRLVICDPRFSDLVVEAGRTCLTLTAREEGGFADLAAASTSIEALAVVAASAPNALVYTSGTTGRPKGAWITTAQVRWNVEAIREMWAIGPDDVLLHINLIAYGVFATMLPMLSAGAGLFLVEDAGVDTILDGLPHATMMASVPTVYQRLLSEPRFTRELCSRIRLFITGSAPMREDLFEAFAAHTGHRLLDRYGMTEALLITSNRADHSREAGNSGYPLPKSTLRIIGSDGRPLPAGEVGQIQILQPAPFTGYLNAPEKTAESLTDDGWLRTGDFGSLDPEGRLSVIGRGTDLIITGGLNVYPKEVEQVLNAQPQIAESAVIGVPHPEYGEAVFAAIELQPDAASTLDTAALRQLLRGAIAGYKVPKHIEIVRKLPRNALGKIKKQELRTSFAEFFRQTSGTRAEPSVP
ncbi:AMP-binding protein [Limoniibacter endophyticus]|uniref:Malonyl-CoA synthase n=1 Tax=Limoniibacter endophyticus TaxID=1565040 RepID=A0A8J3DJK4_9HYPH|nr:AMP-binding protein [Limoniibacter endophyticus]GHC78867.1 malonyl-CoA synthase [Limoniibacter endophyticus]